MILHAHPYQPNVHRVLMFAEEKSLELDSNQIEMFEREHLTAEYKQKNPLGQVPVLELDDGTYIAESIAICRFLEEEHPSPPLLGTTSMERALIEMWQRRTEFGLLNASVEFGHHTHDWFADKYEQIPDWGRYNEKHIAQTFMLLDDHLASNEFIAGENFSIADITAYCGIALAYLWDIKIKDQPALSEWRKRISLRPSTNVVKFGP